MPRKLPPEHSRFKPGQSGNPGGMPRLPNHLRGIKEFTGEEVKRTFAKYMRMTREELKDVTHDEQTTMLDVTICSILINAAKSGDYSRVDFLLNRCVGKVKEVMEIRQPEPILIKRPSGEEITVGVKED